MDIKKEKSLVVIKPEGVQRALIGEIITRFEKVGLKLIAIKMVIPTSDIVNKHYLIDPEWLVKVGTKAISAYEKKGMEAPSKNPEEAGKRVLEGLVKYFTAGPVVAMVWQGVGSVATVRKLVGSTEPASSDVGTIRGDLTIDSYIISDTDGRAMRNIVHASGNVSEAEKEIALWFAENELISYRLVSESLLYDVDLNGILE